MMLGPGSERDSGLSSSWSREEEIGAYDDEGGHGEGTLTTERSNAEAAAWAESGQCHSNRAGGVECSM